MESGGYVSDELVIEMLEGRLALQARLAERARVYGPRQRPAPVHEPPRVVMDKAIHQWPVLGFLFKQANTIPIASAKSDPKALERAMDSISTALREGWAVVIFPEGKLNDDGKVGEFRNGIERMARQCL